jgi:hypothetical protein
MDAIIRTATTAIIIPIGRGTTVTGVTIKIKGDSMIYTRLVAVAVVLLCGSLDFPCHAANQPQTYTKNDIDAKLDNLRAEITGKTISKTDINARFDELRELIKETSTKSEVDAKLNAVQQVVNVYKKGADDQGQRISDELKATNDRIPSVPWWAPPLVSLVAAAGSIIVSWRIAVGNRAQSDVQRAKDKAWSLIEQWGASFDKVSRALGALRQPQSLNDPDNLLGVLAVGNMYDVIGRTWKTGDADKKVLEENNMKAQADEFWKDVMRAKQELAKVPNNTVDLDKPIREWPDLAWLATVA